MIYISPEGDYPRHYGDIMLAAPSWKLGDELPAGWHKVQEAEFPVASNDEVVEESLPTLKSGKYVQTFIVRPMTPEEIERRDAPKIARQKLLDLGLTELEINELVKGLR